ncbi:YnbE family lipoprotein [uncultured Erythrobacter sp.]|uniref:YnbE family lipoprotein n=1 Tax=uncultured Erythrobacter sp. TaxID=263913 RepID=UPI00260DA479|nr:YnbE family lipoprotein [uncultured Erythrobacter sp.]
MDWNRLWALLGSMAFLGTSGCINVAAPEEPIVIELNVNIEARLLVELAEDASNTIDENADIF